MGTHNIHVGSKVPKSPAVFVQNGTNCDPVRAIKLFRPGPQIATIPLDHALQPVLNVARLGEAMVLTRIDHQLRRHVQAA